MRVQAKLIVSLAMAMIYCNGAGAQTLPANRIVDWTRCGTENSQVDYQQMPIASLSNFGLTATSTPTDNVTAFDDAVSSLGTGGGVVYIPAGSYTFDATLDIPSHVYVMGAGADQTTVVFDIAGNQNGFRIKGSASSQYDTLTGAISMRQVHISLATTTGYSAGDWIQIIQNDSSLTHNNWANQKIGQILQIDSVTTNELYLNNQIRLDIPLSRTPRIRKLSPVTDAGISCLSIVRADSSSIGVTGNIRMQYATNCLIENIQSTYCKFAHILAEWSAYTTIRTSYFEKSFDYGGGGNGYGVLLQFATGDFLVENNIFDHLRHSMVLQAGANGNVFGYNYSVDPYWTSFPSDAAGEIVCHGNYPFANLFEHNICGHIIVDQSHGQNGPYNTFFRNRATYYGIRVTDNTATDLNFVGNEITYNSWPINQLNYSIPSGQNHYTYGNNHLGTITPSGTSALAEQSLYTATPPAHNTSYFASIGTPNPYQSGDIWAHTQYVSAQPVQDCSGQISLGTTQDSLSLRATDKGVLCTWSVAEREDIRHYKLSKHTGTNWLRLHQPYSSSQNTGYLDTTALTGLHIYQLTAVDMQGLEKVLDTKTIMLSESHAHSPMVYHTDSRLLSLDPMVVSLTIFNSLGQRLISLTNPELSIDLSHLLPGTYMIHYQTRSGQHAAEKLTVF